MSNNHYVFYTLKQYGIIIGAALLTALSLELFLIPSEVVMGGAIGIASIIDILTQEQWYFSAGIWVAVVNIPILIYCFVNYRRRFALKTMTYVLLLCAIMIVLRVVGAADFMAGILKTGEISGDKVMYTLIGAALQGFALPLMLSVNGSTGGSDIVGLIMQKKSRRSSSESMRAIFLCNVVIVAASSLTLFFCRGKDIQGAINMVVYSLAAIFVGEIVQETAFKGFSAAIELEITTDYPCEMAEKLRQELYHGSTSVKIRGGYSNAEKTMVICVINRRQLTKARRIIREIDINAFAYVEQVKEVIGKGFVNKEIELENDEKQ